MTEANSKTRFEEFIERIGALCDLSRERVEALLLSIDDDSRWSPGPVGGVALFAIDAGPSLADAIVGFVRMEPGVTFPRHEHVGDERVLVLQGAYRDEHGVVHRRGELCAMAAGSAHAITALEGPPMIHVVVAERGVLFVDESDAKVFVGPDDPRM